MNDIIGVYLRNSRVIHSYRLSHIKYSANMALIRKYLTHYGYINIFLYKNEIYNHLSRE